MTVAVTPRGWKQRGGAIVSYGDQPSAMRFIGELPGTEHFSFGRRVF